MWILVRAVIWATLFISFMLVFLPLRVLAWSGITAAIPAIGVWQVVGMILTAGGAAFAFWCILTFVFVGKGTSAPFDPPRRLVVEGPYRFVRNPIYVGAAFALIGAALFYRSLALLAYLGLLAAIIQVLVVYYEEPTLRRTFGQDYLDYCARVGRWWPKF